MAESVIITLNASLVKRLDELKPNEDSTYDEVIEQLLLYIGDADNYVTEEERQEIIDAIREREEKGYFTAAEIRKMIEKKIS